MPDLALISPYQSDQLKPLFVADDAEREHLHARARAAPPMVISSAAAANAVMLGAGYFTPLNGFMSKADALSVADSMHTSEGLFWPVPVLNLVDHCASSFINRTIALRDPNIETHPVLAVQKVDCLEELTDAEIAYIAERTFGTADQNHPGVKKFLSQGRFLLSGPIQVLNFSYFEKEFVGTFRTATQIRDEIKAQGWRRVVAFQTRNPMHRAHEELCKMAAKSVAADGVLIHMLLGKLKSGDIPAQVRDAAIRKMVELYFEPNTVIIAGYGFDMLYAGPREAVLHAIFRQNAGCSHLIVGRDHAGVGDYYGAFDAQLIFDQAVPDEALEIQIFRADHTAYSKKLDRVVMMRDVPDHNTEDFVLLSGTRVRELLAAGKPLPREFARPEVAEILRQHFLDSHNRAAD
ncbi:MAG: sulfate adenylyltransferase [Pseudomonadota bacterium]|nr:sulfate adenylyltransferase [Pseudomonadota bacterium]